MESSQEALLYSELMARIRKMLEPVAHDSFLFYEDTIQLFEPYVKEGMKVLDAGSGRGIFTAWLADKGCSVVAIDASVDHIAQTRQLVEDRKISDRVKLEASRLPEQFPEDHFDLIIDCFSWWHISDWGRLFNLSRKNLKPQGKLLILDTFYSWSSTLDFRREMLERWKTAFPTFNECKNMLIKREFRILKVQPVQEAYSRYLDSLYRKIEELEREGLGTLDPTQLKEIKSMWEWFRKNAEKEELVATFIAAELT